MIALIKALIPGGLLTWIVASVIGSNGSTGGMLHIAKLPVAHHELYWSWPLFIAATALAWFILAMLD
ncbi:MAG: hypothetical protein ABIQ81_06095 [Novosphingobium sp.]